MVDVGISYRQITTKLAEKDIDLNQINVLFITHDHSDHVKGLDVFIKNNPQVTIYMLESTFHNIKKKYLTEEYVSFINYNDDLYLNQINIHLIETSHDADGSFALIMSDDNSKVVHMTDTGYISSVNLDKIKNCDAILLESNYDDQMIMDNTRYPYMTKKRIMSNTGHLSNTQCREYLQEIISTNTKLILYGHLSENNNTPSLVQITCNEFACTQFILHPSELIEVKDVDKL